MAVHGILSTSTPLPSSKSVELPADVRIKPLTREDVLFDEEGVNNIFSRVCDFIKDAFYWLTSWICCCCKEDILPTSTIIVKGSLLDQQVEAIVNAANERCLGGGGIDGVIHTAAGSGLLEECEKLPVQEIRISYPPEREGKTPKPIKTEIRCPIGSAVITASHNLGKTEDEIKRINAGLPKGKKPLSVCKGNGHIKYIIHTTGPMYDKKNTATVAKQLASCYFSSLEIARSKGIKTIAFPLISGGIFGYPTEEASKIAVSTIRKYCAKHPGAFDAVKLVIIEEDKYKVALRATADISENPVDPALLVVESDTSESDSDES